MAVEVCHQPDRVGKVLAVLERGCSLVVDEQEAQPARWVGDRPGSDHRLKQLALPGTGRPPDQGVRAVRAKVDDEGAGCADTDQGAAVLAVLVPAIEDGCRRRVLYLQELEKRDPRRDLTARSA